MTGVDFTKNILENMKNTSIALNLIAVLCISFFGHTAQAQYSESIQYPIISSPMKKLSSAKGYRKDEEKGWMESQNATSSSDKFRFLEIRKISIEGKEYLMLSQHCMEKLHFFIIEKSDFAKLKIKEDAIVCNRLPVKYFGSVNYIKDSVSYRDLEDEIMRRIVFQNTLQDAMDRFTYNFCINTYYDRVMHAVRYYTCFEKKSVIDEYVALNNCNYRKSYSDILVSPQIFEDRYFLLDVTLFKKFWGFE